MKTRSIIAAGIGAMLCFAGIGCSNNRTDIALEGPWLLYQDTQFDDNGHKVAVLIAIASGDTFDIKDVSEVGYVPKSSMLHKPPQLSTGDGFFIGKAGVYCLAFDKICALKGAASLKSDRYQTAVPLQIHPGNAKSGHWDWPKAISGDNIALILPMPDSYSNDGVWHMRFGSSFSSDGSKYGSDERHSIGLQLHYKSGPENFNLLECDRSAGLPSVENCQKTPAVSKRTTRLENFGTLRIQMKAPDSDNGCDNHVRFSYKGMFAVDKSFQADKAVIEPAHLAGDPLAMAYDNAQDHFCLDKDPQGIHPAEDMDEMQSSTTLGLGRNLPTENTTGLNDTSLSTVPATILSYLAPSGACNGKPGPANWCWNPSELSNEHFTAGVNYLRAAQGASAGLDPNFPKVSQVLQIAQFLRMAGKAMGRFESDRGADLTALQRGALGAIVEKLKPLDNANGPGKNGSDCRAVLMMVQ